VLYGPGHDAMYEPPRGPLAVAPFDALAAIEQPPAMALLSASWSVYLATRLPTDLHWLDRLELLMRAREAICSPPSGTTEEALDRWRRLFGRFGVRGELRRLGFDTADINAITTRGWTLRNLSAHGPDEALLSIGYPPDRVRAFRSGQEITGAELSPLHIRYVVDTTFAAVSHVARRLWEAMQTDGFSVVAWERLFNP
jgi:hypothetical protein